MHGPKWVFLNVNAETFFYLTEVLRGYPSYKFNISLRRLFTVVNDAEYQREINLIFLN